MFGLASFALVLALIEQVPGLAPETCGLPNIPCAALPVGEPAWPRLTRLPDCKSMHTAAFSPKATSIKPSPHPTPPNPTLTPTFLPKVVLEVLENNVKRGSQCYEQGHHVVLAYCESSRGIAQARARRTIR